MADKKISQLTGATTPLAGTEEIPLVQSSTTKKATVANLTAGRAVSMDSLGLGGTAPVAYAAIEWGPSAAVTYGVELTPLLNANTTNVQMFRARPRATANTHTDVTAFYAGLDGLASASTTTTAYGLRVASPTGGVTNLYGVHSAITSGAGRYHIYLSTDANSYTAGNWQFASGKGIDFSATAGAGTSELLNDYEEGTWSPTIIGTTTAGTATYDVRNTSYTKIGRLVHVEAYMVYSAGTGVGDLRIGNLPYAVENTYSTYTPIVCRQSSIAVPVGDQIYGRAEPGTSYIRMYSITNAGAQTDLAYEDNAFIAFQANYTAA